MAAESGSVRRALGAIRKRIRAIEPGADYRAGCGWYNLAGELVGYGDRTAAIHVVLAKAEGNSVLLGVYEWARCGERDSDQWRYRWL